MEKHPKVFTMVLSCTANYPMRGEEVPFLYFTTIFSLLQYELQRAGTIYTLFNVDSLAPRTVGTQ